MGGSRIRLNKVCQHCGKAFIARTTVTKYCGDTCAKRAYKKRKREEKLIQAAQDEKARMMENSSVETESIKQCLSVKEVAAYLGISEPTIYRMVNRDLIPHARFGKRIVIRREDLHELFQEL